MPLDSSDAQGERSCLARRVEAESERWRRVEEEQGRLWREIEALPEESALWFVVRLMVELGDEADALQSRLLRELRVGVFPITDGAKLHWDVRLPLPMRISENEARSYSLWLGAILMNGHVIWSAVKAIRQGLGIPDILAAVRKALVEGPIVLAGVAQSNPSLAPLDDQRAAATVVAAGWADARIRQFGRMEKALRTLDSDTLKAKRCALPASTYLAWAERGPREPLTGRGSTLARITRNLTSLGSEPGVRRLRKDPPDPAWSWATGSEARAQIEALREVSQLSRQENQVLDLLLEGYKEEEITSQLGVKVGSIWSVTSRIKAKLLKAQLGL